MKPMYKLRGGMYLGGVLRLLAATLLISAILPAHSVETEGWAQTTWPTRITALAFEEPFAWLGTDAGLVRLDLRDGSARTFHTGNSGLGENRILSLAVGPSGEKWLGTRTGLAFHRPGMWDFYDPANSPLARGLGPEEIPFVAVDRLGHAWASAEVMAGGSRHQGGFVYRFDGSAWTRIFANRIHHVLRMQGLAVARDTLWMAVQGLYQYKGPTWYDYWVMPVPIGTGTLEESEPLRRTYPALENGGVPSQWRQVLPDGQGSFWTASRNLRTQAIQIRSGRDWQSPLPLPEPGELPGDYVVATDTAHALWAWATGRLYRWEGGTWVGKALEDTLERLRGVNEVRFDGSGRLILKTDSALHWRTATGWLSWDVRKLGPPWKRVRSLAVDASGRKWVGASNGLFREEAGGWIRMHPGNSGLPHLDLGPMRFDGNGTLWILSRSPPDSMGKSDPLPENPLFRSFPSLASYDGRTWKTYGAKDGIPEGVGLTGFAADRKGNLWMSSEDGLFRLQGEAWTRSLAGTAFHGIAVDAADRLWAGGTVVGEGGVSGVRGKVYRIDADGAGVAASRVMGSMFDCPALIPAADGSMLVAGPMVGPGADPWKTRYSQVWSFSPSFEEKQIPPGTAPFYRISQLAGDSGGGVWAVVAQGDQVMTDDQSVWEQYGHRRSVMRWKDGKWSEFTPKNSGLQDPEIQAFAAGPDGTVWFATANGLSSAAAKTFPVSSAKAPRPSQAAFDGFRNGWIMEREGYIRIEVFGVDGRSSGIALQGHLAPGRHPLDLGVGYGPRILRITGKDPALPTYLRVPGLSQGRR